MSSNTPFKNGDYFFNIHFVISLSVQSRYSPEWASAFRIPG